MDYKTLYEAELTKNKELKEFRDSVIDTLKCDDDLKDSEIIDMIDEMENDWDPNHYQELKEENKILKDKSKGFKTLFREVRRLTKYETMIHCVWSDLYWADKGGCEVSFKDVSASCDYYENEDFIKKEVVDDSEEEDEKKKFLERHDISEDDMKELMKQCGGRI